MYVNAGGKFFEKHRKHMMRWHMTEVYVAEFEILTSTSKEGQCFYHSYGAIILRSVCYASGKITEQNLS